MNMSAASYIERHKCPLYTAIQVIEGRCANRNKDGTVFCWIGGGTGKEEATFLRIIRSSLALAHVVQRTSRIGRGAGTPVAETLSAAQVVTAAAARTDKLRVLLTWITKPGAVLGPKRAMDRVAVYRSEI